MSPETIQRILESAVQAPSGENAQPWRFAVRGNEISLFNVPENDQSLYNFQQRASSIAHGAVIENISIAAGHFGLMASVTIMSKGDDTNLVATILLSEVGDGSGNDGFFLYPFIAERSTNRKIYKGGAIPAPVIKTLSDAGKEMEGIEVAFVTEPSNIKRLANIASVNDSLLLENKSLHDFFFSHVHWTLEEEVKERSGFYIEVLELLPPARAMFRLFKHWAIMRIFNALGAAKMGAKENSKIYASASAIGIITITDERTRSFIDAGRVLQRLWLTATKEGLSMQPLTGVLFFYQRIVAGEGDVFTDGQKEAVEKAYEGIQSIFDTDGKTIVMMFRIGYADPPTASSLKKPPAITTLS